MATLLAIKNTNAAARIVEALGFMLRPRLEAFGSAKFIVIIE